MAEDVVVAPTQQPQKQQTGPGMQRTGKLPDGSSGAKGQSSDDASLLFSPSLDEQILESGVGDESGSYDPLLEIQRIKLTCTLTNDAERRLASAVHEAKATSTMQTGCADLHWVGRYLRSKHGYLVYVRHANLQKRAKAYLRLLRHDFLVIRGIEGATAADVLVDLNFRDHFVLPHATSWYSKLVAALPQDWIGTAAKLAPLVGMMSAAIRLCFKQLGVPLPPWREGRAVLSKWISDVFVDEPVPLMPLPDVALKRLLAPYHKPFRAAVNSTAALQDQQPFSTAIVTAQQQVASFGRVSPLRPPCHVGNVAPVAAARAAAGAHGDTKLAWPDICHPVMAPQVPTTMTTADVPRKIIVGFPDQGPQPALWQQQQDFQDVDSSSTADADVYLQRHLHVPHCKQVQQQAKPAPAVDAAGAAAEVQQQITRALAPAGPLHEETVRNGKQTGGLKALPEQQPVDFSAENLAAVQTQEAAKRHVAPAACEATVRLVNRTAAVSSDSKSKQERERNAPQKVEVQRSGPAFTTRGVVMGSCCGSPGVVVNKQLLQLQMAAGGDSTAAAAVRQFKPLDQLLPKMKVIKLGC